MTMSVDVPKMQRFIEELEIAEVPRSVAKLPRTELEMTSEQSAAVDAGSLISFLEGMDPQHKKDVLNSTLLAQLAANKQYDREQDPERWYTYYREVLENVGWVVGSWDFDRFSSSSASYEVDAVVLAVLRAVCTPNQLLLAVAALEALKKAPEEGKPAKLFDTQGANGEKGNFQIGSCVSSGGNVSLSIGVFYFSTETVVRRILFYKFNSVKTSMYKGGQSIVLNEEVYAKVRKAVVDKLGDKAASFVADLEI